MLANMQYKSVKAKSQRRELDNLPVERMSRGISIISPTHEMIKSLLLGAEKEINGLASLEAVSKVYHHNPDSIMCVVRKDTNDRFPSADSFVAQLPLNKAGLDALFEGKINLSSPQLKYISEQGADVSAIYVWLIYLNSRTSGSIGLISQRMNMPQYQNAPLYCRPINDKAGEFFTSLGFTKGAKHKDTVLDDYMTYERVAQKSKTVGDTSNKTFYSAKRQHLQNEPVTRVEVVHCIEDYQKVIALRAATYIAEQDCPYWEEYDGNDFAATHLIGYCGDEPAGCLRMRFFADFAKVERLAVLPRFRKTKLSFDLIKAGKKLAGQKGYTHLYGQAEAKLVNLWRRHGFIPRTNEATISFSGNHYIEGDLFLEPANQTVGSNSSGDIINRPEGHWDTPGVLENKQII